MQYTLNYFTSDDGTQLCYRLIGKGKTTLVLCDGVGCAGYIWQHLIPFFVQDYTILHIQYRGHGHSAVPDDLSSMSVEQFALDLISLLDHKLAKRQLVLLGHSMCVQVALECYHQIPERIQALILINGPYGHALQHVHGTGVFAQALPAVQSLVNRWHSHVQRLWQPLMDSELSYWIAMVFEVNPFLTNRKDFRPYFEELGTMDPQAFLAAVQHANTHSAWDYLPEIKVPVLVIASEKDRFTPFSVVKKMFEAIPRAELLVLPTASHIGPLELPELVNLRIEKFLDQKLMKRGIAAKSKKSL